MRWVLITSLLAAANLSTAKAESALSGSLALELNDRTTIPASTHHSRVDIFGVAEADVAVKFTERWSARAVATLEPLADPDPREDRSFENEDVRWKDVYVQYDDGVFGLRGGRITANFGQAWYAAPGLDAATLAEDYAIWDRMGASAWYRFQATALGDITLGAALFSLDTSELSRSWHNTRSQKSRQSGGVSNTGAPLSYSLSLDGSVVPGLPGFSWHLAVLRQQVDFVVDGTGQRVDDVADEKGVVAGIQQKIRITDRLESISLLEAAHLDDKSGVPGAWASYVTLGETLRWGKYYGQLAYTVRRSEVQIIGESGASIGMSSNARSDTLVGLTVGYQFTDALSFDAGWRRTRVDSATEEQVRARLKYVMRF